jgi:hypothetical protein
VPRLEDDHNRALIGQGGWTLGPAWDRLEVLELRNLSQPGVSLGHHERLLISAQAKSLASYFELLSAFPPLLHTLTLTTQFLDGSLTSAISRYGCLGRLEHLTLGTSGTKLLSSHLREIVEGCTGLVSLTLDDIEGV